MKSRTRQLVLLAVATVAFASMLVLVATGVSVRRARRDLTFGLEELDALLDTAEASLDGSSLDEASAMIPWLAARARTAGEGLRVLRRAHTVYERTANAEPLSQAAALLLAEFPANTTIAAIATFAEVRAGRPQSGLAIARERVGSENPAIHAWALLSASAAPDERDDGELILAALGPASPAEDFERAWELTGDERYALDAVLLLLRDGDIERSVALATRAGLVATRPLFVAGLLLDAGRFREAADVLESRAPRSRAGLMLLADAYLYAGDNDSARGVYETMIETDDAPVEAYLNLAWLSDDREHAVDLLRRASLYHDTWELDRARALAGPTPGLHADLVVRWTGSAHEADARLLGLMLDDEPDRRGFAADLWVLLERFPTPEAFRFAAWYFSTRDQMSEVRMVVERAGGLRAPDEPEPAWSLFYRGLLDAGEGSWRTAVDRFRESFVRSPSWPAALNASLASYRIGDRNTGERRMQDAVLLARNASGRRRTAVFLAAARVSRDDAELRTYIAEALTIDPGSPEALLLSAQLDNPNGR